MDKTFDPQIVEQRWRQTWQQTGVFKAVAAEQTFAIVLPPPNVTGSLHMGHGFQDTLMDALIRYHRMQGEDALWQAGLDHAGIATQMVVERQLAAEGKTRHELGRAAFIDRVWQWRHQSGGTISQQMQRLGTAIDWERERFTMDAGLTAAVQTVFVQLYDQGLLYRGKRLVNWDPKLLTAISDLEVITQEEPGLLWHIRYPSVDGKTCVTVATTRPETLFGDVAVAVHPNDPRYQHLIGQMLRLPLTDRAIPVIADDYVEPEFGTGCVKITPAHDFNDYQVGKRHNLPIINIFTPEAQLNAQAPQEYQGLDRFVARKKVLAALQQLNLLVQEQHHQLKVPRGDRSGEILEPYLTDQWFVKAAPLAAPALAAVADGEIEFVPDTWKKTYFQWLENIEDWCISRQLWWGHRIPAWYDHSGQVYVAHSEAEARQKYQLPAALSLTQDDDVLDTWFSSALWPFSSLGWPEQTQDLQRYYPTTVLVTGFDILFFWVARMVMMGLHFTGKVPFKKVYITGLIRDHDGQKMSKSKGNVLDPIDIIDGISLEALVAKRTTGLMQPQMVKKIDQATRKQFPEGILAYGTDALRFTFCALATQGRDIRFELERVAGYRNFCNKIWNAARYVLMNTEGQTLATDLAQAQLSLPDRFILAKLQHVIAEAQRHFGQYRFDLLAQTLYEFMWNEYCDWYLELSKPILQSTSFSETTKQATRATLLHVLENFLRLVHPLMPFISEEIWQRIAPLLHKSSASLLLQPYPQVEAQWFDEESEAEVAWLKTIVVSVRTIRSEMNISPAKQVPLLLRQGDALDQQRVEKNKIYLQTLLKLESIVWLSTGETAPAAATVLTGQLELLVSLAGLIDLNAERTRLQKEINKLQQEVASLTAKLANQNYVNKAPAAVVAKDRLREQEGQTALAKLVAQYNKL